jgi:hypothetical protein
MKVPRLLLGMLASLASDALDRALDAIEDRWPDFEGSDVDKAFTRLCVSLGTLAVRLGYDTRCGQQVSWRSA